MELTLPSGCVLRAVSGDITKIKADAIVNAANSGLVGGGGVDGAIHRAGGPSIMRELDAIRRERGGCPTGQAVATSAGSLPAQYVFHAVGPVYRDGRSGEAELLASCYSVCLRMAQERGVATITFPAISTGVYGYPADEAAEIAVRTVAETVGRERGSVAEVVFVLFGRAAEEAYRTALASLRPSGV